MDDLLKKYNEFMLLENCRVEYKLSNGDVIEVTYLEENFAHLLGLHKLKDIQLIQFWLDKHKIKRSYSPNQKFNIYRCNGKIKCVLSRYTG